MGKDLNGKDLGEGISQRKDGLYTARFVSKTGKRVQKYFSKPMEAKLWLRDARYEDAHGMIAAGSGMTFDAWFAYWLDNVKGDTIRHGTREAYLYRYRSRMMDALGAMQLSEIKPVHCQNVLNIAAEQESGGSVRKVRTIMHEVLEAAVENEMIAKNPVTKSVRCKAEKAKERRVLTQAEQKRFLELAAESSYFSEYAFVLQTGLRCGEMQGLHWADVDWTEKTIEVTCTLEYRKDWGKFAENPPKTKSGYRTIPLTDEALAILQRKYQERKEMPAIIGYHDLVFRNQFGKPTHRGSLNKPLRKIAKEMGIEAFSMHCLRHTFATRCIEAGMRPKTLQKILGHSTLSMTMDLYVHVTDETIFDEMQKFNRCVNVVSEAI